MVIKWLTLPPAYCPTIILFSGFNWRFTRDQLLNASSRHSDRQQIYVKNCIRTQKKKKNKLVARRSKVTLFTWRASLRPTGICRWGSAAVTPAGREAVIRQPGLLGPALTARSQLDAKSRPAQNNYPTHTSRGSTACQSQNEQMIKDTWRLSFGFKQYFSYFDSHGSNYVKTMLED